MATERIDPLDEGIIDRPYMYGKAFVIAFAVYGILWYFWSERMVVSFNELWTTHGSVSEAFSRIWWVFLWGFGLTFLVGMIIVIRGVEREYDPGETLLKGAWISLNAGFFEELIYRWLLFFGAMVTLPFINFITFGFVKWLYTQALIPLANWATFHALDPQLTQQHYWILGAAIISANADFRGAHLLNGPFNWVNAWYGGMLLFWVALNYGLWVAILVHIVYDMVAFTAEAITTAMRPKARYHPYIRLYRL
jgi:hypothetical protein